MNIGSIIQNQLGDFVGQPESCFKRQDRAGRMTIQKGLASGGINDGLKILNFPFDAIGMSVTTVTTAPAVVCIDSEIMSENLGILYDGLERPKTYSSGHI